MEDKPPAPKKRSLFTQAALSKKTKAVEAEDLIFNRAKELEAERLAEEERLRQKRIQRAEKKRYAQTASRQLDSETPPKKRKISVTVGAIEGNDSDNSNGPEKPEEPTSATRKSKVSSSPGSSRKRPSSSHNRGPPLSPSTTLSARYSKSLLKSQESKDQSKEKGYISVTDSDDSDGPTAILDKKQGTRPITIDDDDDDEVECVSGVPILEPHDEDPLFDEDEEFPELVQRARERERLRLLQAANAERSFTEQNHSQDEYDAFATEPPKDVDPSIEILITSRMDDTIPLKVKRKLSQRLKEARFAWCDKQNLRLFTSAELKNSIFLTWKHKRLFDYTSCRALGLKSNDLGLSDDEGVYEGKVHLEAWTEEAFEQAQKEEEAARRREELGEGEEEPEVQEEVKVRLVMTARDMEPVKLVAKGSTPIEKLILAFRSSRSISDEKEVSLWLDGEKLDFEDVVEDTELEDMDNIEVHIK